MAPSSARLQRVLGSALVLAVLLSAWLLWNLWSEGPRGGTRVPSAGSGEAPPTGSLAAANAAAEPVEPGSARTEQTTAPATTPATASEGSDLTAVTGVVTGDGAPLAGVELLLFRDSLERRETREPRARAVTDAEGRFRIDGLEPHARHELLCQTPGFLSWHGPVFPGRDEEVELEPSATLSGRVLAATTLQPLAGIGVALRSEHWGPAGLEDLVSTTSAADGHWELAWAEPGIVELFVVRPGRLPERHEFQVERGGGDGFDILLDDALALELEVFDLASGALLADTELLAEAPVRTDARGHVGWPLPAGGVPDGGLQVSLSLPGGCLTQVRVDPSDAQGTLRVPVTRGGIVRGTVLDAQGTAVESARVRLSGGGRPPAALALPSGCSLHAARIPVRTGADGRFELRGLPPREGTVEVRAQHPEHPPGSSGPSRSTRSAPRPASRSASSAAPRSRDA
jgi:hypothetical protein